MEKQANFRDLNLKNAREVLYLLSRWCVTNPARDLSGVAEHMKIAGSNADCEPHSTMGDQAMGFKGIYILCIQQLLSSTKAGFEELRL